MARNFYVNTAERERDEMQHKNNLEFIEAIRKRGEKIDSSIKRCNVRS